MSVIDMNSPLTQVAFHAAEGIRADLAAHRAETTSLTAEFHSRSEASLALWLLAPDDTEIGAVDATVKHSQDDDGETYRIQIQRGSGMAILTGKTQPGQDTTFGTLDGAVKYLRDEFRTRFTQMLAPA